MKDKILTIYLNIFCFFAYISSAISAFNLLDRLNIPNGSFHALIYYGYFLIHTISFIAMFWNRKKLFKTDKKE